MMLDIPQISQLSALLLEHVRNKGVPEMELQRAIREENIPFLNEISDDDYHYDELFTYAKRLGENLEKALLEGYTMKFNTKDGLQAWLSLKFGFEEGSDYRTEEEQIKDLVIGESERQSIESALADNWAMETVEERNEKDGQKVILHVSAWFDKPDL
ncbi:hypothetical protein EPH95_10585 [Salicibibacter halophilus]|uniref:Uncharacterized protein n=1 Tax=Salicibibacter halophilus TaxID=2502791 RepID=A0A514LI88_9BACI|nr:hypothetical protein [Salicibibacter halophilus]QDI91564.1 hypothetical protein EPH95_10585 [Salicibibacter halophilus]